VSITPHFPLKLNIFLAGIAPQQQHCPKYLAHPCRVIIALASKGMIRLKWQCTRRTKHRMSTYRLILIGFGVVGRGLAGLLVEKAAALQTDYGFQANIVGVGTRRGVIFHPEGLSIAALLSADSPSAYPDTPGLQRLASVDELVARPDYDVLIEASPTDLKTGQPARSHMERAMASGRHVATVNKGPVALAYGTLRALAATHKVFFGYEGVVMGGTPNLRMAEFGLAGCQIKSVRGIVNSTTNFILTRMTSGASYAEALAEAQALGYAETDPTADVEGFDAAGKVAILSAVIFNAPLQLEQIQIKGITGISQADIQAATAQGERWRLVASLASDGQTIRAAVGPQRLPASDPLAGIDGATNALTYETDILGHTTIVGAGAGGRATGYALLSDLIMLHRLHGSR
jgi:homoserine dehydrogenase